MSGRLHGKVCFITGTAGGQGAAAAELFAAEGATVVGCDIKVDGIDLSDPEHAARWIETGVAQAGRIDVLYNNASATRVGPFERAHVGRLAVRPAQRARPDLHRDQGSVAAPEG